MNTVAMKAMFDNLLPGYYLADETEIVYFGPEDQDFETLCQYLAHQYRSYSDRIKEWMENPELSQQPLSFDINGSQSWIFLKSATD